MCEFVLLMHDACDAWTDVLRPVTTHTPTQPSENPLLSVAPASLSGLASGWVAAQRALGSRGGGGAGGRGGAGGHTRGVSAPPPQPPHELPAAASTSDSDSASASASTSDSASAPSSPAIGESVPAHPLTFVQCHGAPARHGARAARSCRGKARSCTPPREEGGQAADTDTALPEEIRIANKQKKKLRHWLQSSLKTFDRGEEEGTP